MPYTIREATTPDIPGLVEIIRTSFHDVADRFSLTEENCPKHPSNCRATWIAGALDNGIRYFILDSNGLSCGCVALEQASPDVCYLERLAVLPLQRRQGFGKALAECVLSEAKELGANRVDIGIMAHHTELRDWYGKIGFVEQKTADFAHLPFSVLFMSMFLRGGKERP
jgi:N-acetylglutamate synthase-like GNAT family acetyltransferase